MKNKKASMKSLEKMLRNHYGYECNEALSYLRRTGQVFINGQKYTISKKDKMISFIGRENYKSIRKSKKNKRF